MGGGARGTKDPESDFTNALAKIIQTQFEINAEHLKGEPHAPRRRRLES